MNYLNVGSIFGFILSAFTTVTTVLPFLTQSSENNNPEIYTTQALYNLLNRSPSPNDNGNILSAEVTLHEVRDVQNQTAKMLLPDEMVRSLMNVTGLGYYSALLMGSEGDLIHSLPVPNEVLLSYAAMNYNINQPAIAEEFINHIQCGNDSDCLQKVWYFNRILDINEPNNNNVVHEDRNCNTTNWNCTQKNLADIHNKISNLLQSGYNHQFYNDRSPVDSLEKPLDTFVSNMHSLIIICLIIVVIVLLGKGTVIKQLFTRTV